MLFTTLNRLDRGWIRGEVTSYMREHGIQDTLHQLTPALTMEDAICDIVEAIISNAAEADKQNFRAKQHAGIQRARENGQSIGRPTQKQPKKFNKIRQMYADKKVTGREAARMLGVAQSTFYRWLREETESIRS
jgi:DNA invertase Pin-like site-specific DNA recombinase